MFTIQVMNDLTWVIFLLIVSASKGAFESHMLLYPSLSLSLLQHLLKHLQNFFRIACTQVFQLFRIFATRQIQILLIKQFTIDVKCQCVSISVCSDNMPCPQSQSALSTYEILSFIVLCQQTNFLVTGVVTFQLQSALLSKLLSCRVLFQHY